MTLPAPPMAAPVASILIVEDEAVVALHLKMELETLGYQVVGVADTASHALELARRHRPSLTLMDIVLKGDMDGVAAAEVLRRELAVPVVFLTSFSDADTVRRAARTAPYGYLTKPFQIKELRAGIEVALWKSQMERQLRESERWFALTLRCVQDGVVVIGTLGHIRFMNLAAETLLGWSAEEALDRLVSEVVAFDPDGDDGRPLALRALREGRVLGVRHARRLRRRGGVPLPVDESAGPIHDEQGRPLGAVLVLRDASERRRQEALLRDGDQRFRHAFEFAPLGMALVSLDGRFLQVNEALCHLLACDPSTLLRQSQIDLTHPDDQAHEAARLAELQPGAAPVVQFEKRYLRVPTGKPLCVLVHASRLYQADEPTCYLYQVHDLSEQKAAADQLAELAAERIRREASEQANRNQTEILSRVGHEMRTPLNAVLGFAALLKQQGVGAQNSAAGFPDYIIDAGRHLLALVEDLQDLQQAGRGTLRMQLVTVALDDALPASIRLLEPMAQARRIRMEHVIVPGVQVHADAVRLRQVMLNLGSNAIKYNVHGGTVTFRAGPAGRGRVQISVEDTGIGLSDSQLAHLFEPFNRLGRESLPVQGLGVGLVITRHLVEQMGGTITVSQIAPAGTRVTLDLPMPPPAFSPV